MGSMDWPKPVVEKPAVNRAEKENILKGANIHDQNVLDKIAQVCGVGAETIHENELQELRKNANKGGHQPLEWSVADEKFFIEDDGLIILGNVSRN